MGAGLLVSLAAGWRVAVRRHRPASQAAPADLAVSESTSATEMLDLGYGLRRLEGQVAASQTKSFAERSYPQAGPAPEANPAASRSPDEVGASAAREREIRITQFRKLDDVVKTDDGGTSARSAEAAASEELTRALGSDGHLVAIKCATEVCRIEIEADEGHPPDMVALVTTLPSLRHEALFDHQQLGSVTRTIIYVARTDYMLPLPRAAASPQVPGLDRP